jgi:hypothetical protein
MIPPDNRNVVLSRDVAQRVIPAHLVTRPFGPVWEVGTPKPWLFCEL